MNISRFKLKVKVLFTLIFVLTVSSTLGCSKQDVMYIEQQNNRASEIVKTYNELTNIAKSLEPLIIDSILKGEYADSIQDSIGSNITDEGLKVMLNECHSLVFTLGVDMLTSKVHSEGNKGYYPTDDEVATFLLNLSESVDVLYLLDKDSSTMEQLFILRARDKVIKISLNWLGGVIYDYGYEVS